MKISHECPLAMLDKSIYFNDYDYALVHLFETEPEYLNFYKKCVSNGRQVLLDNSIFELGKAFESAKFADWISELKPTEYIIPDALENALDTMDNALAWKEDYQDRLKKELPNTKSIGVVQGKSYTDLVSCYIYMDETIGVDKIAISFDYSYYREICPHPNKWMSYAMGRIQTLSRLQEDGIINKDKPHHLLGCALPIEFMFYRQGFDWIETLDTSSPIVHGLLGILYNTGGLVSKESIKLVDLLHANPTSDQMSIVWRNLNVFRELVRGF